MPRPADGRWCFRAQTQAASGTSRFSDNCDVDSGTGVGWGAPAYCLAGSVKYGFQLHGNRRSRVLWILERSSIVCPPLSCSSSTVHGRCTVYDNVCQNLGGRMSAQVLEDVCWYTGRVYSSNWPMTAVFNILQATALYSVALMYLHIYLHGMDGTIQSPMQVCVWSFPACV
jgi:hypothetical protein